MKKAVQLSIATVFFVLVFATGLFAAYVFADTADVTFEGSTYTLGNIHGQDGWSKTGGYDVEVTSSFGVPGFDAQSLRFSNSIGSGSFGDWAFSKPLADEAGEVNAQAISFGGTRQSHFEAEFEVRALTLMQQPGLRMDVSPDRGDGARMGLLRIEDMPDGIQITVFDVAGEGPVTFPSSVIASGLSRAVTHKVKFVIDFVEGPSNDVVEIYLNDVLVHTGTTWENYYRFSTESNPNLVNQSRVVDRLLFRSGTAAPATDGMGYLVDNISLSSSGASAPVEETTVVKAADLDPNGPSPVDVFLGGLDKWFFYNDENDTIDNNLGSFVNGPDTAPLGDGSAQISVSGTERRNLATYQFAGTPLSSIRELKFSTYNSSAGNPGSANRSAYVNFNVDFNGTDTWQRRLVFLPSDNGTVMQNTWQEWDAIQDGNAMYRYSGPTWPGTATPGTTARSLNDLLTSYPGIRMRVTDSWLGLRVGEPYADGYTENIDKFVFGTNTYTKTFDFEPTAAPADVTVTIVKYVDGAHATAGNASSLSFPMESTWSNAGFADGSGTFSLASPTYEAQTSPMTNGANYSAQELLDGSNVGASCAELKPFALVGYTVGDTELEAAGFTPSLTAPALTGITEDQFIIVWNEACAPAPSTGTLIVQKIVENDDDGTSDVEDFSFSINGHPSIDFESDGENEFTLAAGTYSIIEDAAAGYTASYTNSENGNLDCDDLELLAGETITCTITNDDDDTPPPPPSGTACDTPGTAPDGYTLLEGTPGRDVVTLNPFTMFVGMGGNDDVRAPNPGNYIICVGDDYDKITIGDGDFTIAGGDSYKSITTGNGNGTIVLGDGPNRIVTGNGDHTIEVGNGNNNITTGNGVDTITTGNGHNRINAGGGNDFITTGGGNDNINGGVGTDTCDAGSGFNTVTNCEL